MLDNNTNKIIILVAGMHRSGTSAISRVLNILGCTLPRTLSGAAPDNVKGFWESPAIRNLNNQILASAGFAWDDWRAFNSCWYTSPVADVFREQAQTILDSEFGDGRIFVLKDPRICRLLPFWINAVRGFGAEPFLVSPIRNPLDVAASLEARDGIDPSIGLLVWLRYLLDAEIASRDLKRAYFRYECLLSEPHAVTDKISDTLGVAWPKRSADTDIVIGEFLTPTLRHHWNEDTSFLADPELSHWLRSSFQIFDRWACGKVQKKDKFALDRLRTAFDDATPAFGRAITVGLKRTQELDAALAERRDRVAGLSMELGATLTALAERQNRVADLSMELDATLTTLAERQDRIAGLSMELDATLTTLAEHEERIVHLDTELLKLRSSTSWRLTVPIRYVGTHAKRTIRYIQFISLSLRSPGAIRKILHTIYITLRRGGVAAIRQKGRLFLEDDIQSGQVTLSQKEQNREFILPDTKSKSDVFILSIINWSFRLQRPQHLAIEFAQSGRRVFYIEMMLEPDGLRIDRIFTNVYRIRLSAKEIGYIQPYTGRATEKQKMRWFEAFSSLCDLVKSTSFKHIIIQHPFWWQMIRSISSEFQLIYDCMDHISGFSNTDNFVQELEEEMIKNCDELIVSSEALFDIWKDTKSPTLIRNAVNIEHFSSENEINSAAFKQNLPPLELSDSDAGILESEAIKVGYVGAIAEWFDAELIRSVALNRPNLEFHLCGTVSDQSVKNILRNVQNIFLYGEIRYMDVPSFLSKMDVLIIPFKILPIVKSCDPVKFYEYSAMSKPTVATRLPELSRAADLVFFASTPDEFSSQIQNAYEMRRNRKFCNILKDFASRNSWKQRSSTFIQVFQDFPLISVVILSYGDMELTKDSIHSLFDQGLTYPKLEVLVVDNGSSSARLEQLKSFVSNYPDIQIIENDSNFGFAKGNNVGIIRATGDYILLLNNDTYVAPGAIHAMVKHLASNPEIGAIGPLTNNIGNEAKISVEYKDMEQMKKIARRITLGFRGRFFQVDALGYFAVMFRRSDLEHFGLLPLDYGIGMFEDDDHCRTIQSKGYITAVAEDGFVHHHLSASFDTWDAAEKKALFEKNKEIFENKWGPWKAHQYRKSRPTKIL